jgi:hypothetical protein
MGTSFRRLSLSGNEQASERAAKRLPDGVSRKAICFDPIQLDAAVPDAALSVPREPGLPVLVPPPEGLRPLAHVGRRLFEPENHVGPSTRFEGPGEFDFQVCQLAQQYGATPAAS